MRPVAMLELECYSGTRGGIAIHVLQYRYGPHSYCNIANTKGVPFFFGRDNECVVFLSALWICGIYLMVSFLVIIMPYWILKTCYVPIIIFYFF